MDPDKELLKKVAKAQKKFAKKRKAEERDQKETNVKALLKASFEERQRKDRMYADADKLGIPIDAVRSKLKKFQDKK